MSHPAMKAAVALQFGDQHDVSVYDNVAVPQPRKGMVLVRVAAASLNPVDVRILRGEFWMIQTLPLIPGGDFSGVVVSTGPSCSGAFLPGDAVFGATRIVGGAIAEYLAVPEHFVAKKPSSVPFGVAASLPICLTTVYQGLVTIGKVQPGERVLVVGASGGTGHFAVQLAKHLGAVVTGVCSGRNAELVRSLGAHNVIDYTQSDWRGEPLRASDAPASAPSPLLPQQPLYDVVFDAVGDDNAYEKAKQVLGASGRFVGISAGHDDLNLSRVLKLGAAMVSNKFWSLLRGPAFYFVNLKMNTADLEACIALVASGSVRAVIEKEYAFETDAVQQAVAQIASVRTRGKIIVRIASEEAAAEFAHTALAPTEPPAPSTPPEQQQQQQQQQGAESGADGR